MQVMVHALWNAIPRFFSVFLMSLLFVLIFAIVGLKLFSGLFYRCNDSSIGDKDSCVGVFENGNGFSVPRAWVNLDYTFDHIGRAFLTLFEIGTLSNWHYVMYAALDVTEKDEQPKRNNSPWFSLYFIVFIIFGAFFLVNFFIGVIIQQINGMMSSSNFHDQFALNRPSVGFIFGIHRSLMRKTLHCVWNLPYQRKEVLHS
jgi:hypothetical protein